MNSTLDDYPRELSYKAKFFYSFFFGVLPLSLQTGVRINWVYIRWNKKVNDKCKLGTEITLWIKLWLLLSVHFLAFFWPTFQMKKIGNNRHKHSWHEDLIGRNSKERPFNTK